MFFTKGSLLYGGDEVGYYSIGGTISTLNPTTIMATLGLIVGDGNYYLAFYITLFFTTLLCVIGMQYLAVDIFEIKNYKKRISLLPILASIFYIFNPTILYSAQHNLIGNLSITNVAIILYLIGIVRFLKEDNDIYANIAISGFGLAIALGGFPANIRMLLTGIFVFYFIAFFKFLFSKKKINIELVKKLLLGSTIFFLTIFVFGAYTLIPLVQNFGGYFHTASYTSTGTFSNINLYSGSFNTLFQVFRLISAWSFQSSYAPYHNIYSSNMIVILASIMWPLLGFGALVFSKRYYKIILPFGLLLLLFIFWDKGLNPPFGIVYSYIVKHIPFGLSAIPTSFFDPLITAKILAIFVAYTIVTMASIDKNFRKLHIVFLLVLVTLVLLSVLPAFQGTLEANYFNQNTTGYFIPSDYQYVNLYLNSNNGTAILFPSLSTYILTNWNYQGSDAFYNNLLGNKSIITSNNFGSYSSLLPNYKAIYRNLTTPVIPSTPLQINNTYKYVNGYGMNITTFGSKVKVIRQVSPSPRLTFVFNKTIDLSHNKYFTIQFNTSNSTKIIDDIDNGLLVVGLNSGRLPYIGWYTITQSCYQCYIKTAGNTITISILIQDMKLDHGSFNISSVNAVDLQFTETDITGLNLTYPKLYENIGYSINPGWINLTKKYNAGYVLFDKSLVTGQLQSYQYTNSTLEYLLQHLYIKQVYSGNYLTLYKINTV